MNASGGSLDDLQKRLGYRFEDPATLELALTHRSHGHEAGTRWRHNETLEFLGDAVLGFVVAEALRKNAPRGVPVGELSKRRSALVSEAALAPRARHLGLGAALRLGKGEESTGGREKPSLLSDVFEAVVAAIYLDGGMEPAREFILRQFPEGVGAASGESAEDPKTRLQEQFQSRGEDPPQYRIVSEEGPDHDRSFTAEVVVKGKVLGRGTGRTKKAASMEAARAAEELSGGRPGSPGRRRPGDDPD